MTKLPVPPPIIAEPSSLDTNPKWKRHDYWYTAWSLESTCGGSWNVTKHGLKYMICMSSSSLLDHFYVTNHLVFESAEEAAKWCEDKEFKLQCRILERKLETNPWWPLKVIRRLMSMR